MAYDVKRYIPTTGPPLHLRARRLLPDKLALGQGRVPENGGPGNCPSLE